MKGNVSREYRLTVFFFGRTLHLKSASDLGMSTGGLSVSAKRHSLSLCALAPLHFHGERLCLLAETESPPVDIPKSLADFK